MNEVKAQLNNYRQSPRKVRLVVDAIRGKKVGDAITTLSFVSKRSTLPLQKLLASAVANAKNLSLSTENLVIKEIRVDAGSTLFRRRPRSHGMSNPIRKRTSHITVTLTNDPRPPRLRSGQATTNNKGKSKKVVGSKLSVVN
jgi:large subunit ribosomal protein L22